MNSKEKNDFLAISLNKLNPNKITRDIIFYFLLVNTIIALILLIIILNPSKSVRNFFFKFIKKSIFKIRLYHILFLIIAIYFYYYLYLKDCFEQIDFDTFKFYYERLNKFHRSYEIESKIWMVFIIIVCLLSIYRYAYLINKEERIKNNI
jgi:hypothetical protein